MVLHALGRLPQVTGILYGVKPVVIAIVVQALWSLGRAAVKSRTHGVVGLAALLAAALTGRTVSILCAAGVLMLALSTFKNRSRTKQLMGIQFPLILGGIAPALAAVSLLPLFLVFLKIGAVVFGSGYVLLAFLRADLVNHLHWLTDAQLLDAVAVGQVTPGPVFTTATFIGYLLAGVPGAAVATIGIFLPGFILVAASGPLIPRLRQSKIAGPFLDGVNVAALALMAVVTWQLGRASIVNYDHCHLSRPRCAVLLLRFRVSSFWLIAIGAATGLLLRP